MPSEPTSTEVLPEPGSTAVDTRSPSRVERRRLFLVLIALTVATRLPAFVVPVFNSDETFLATQAHVIQQGGQLYHDAIDRKPPIVPYLYAATFSFFDTTALWSVRIMAMLAVAITAFLLALEARRRYGGRAGWIAGLLCVGAMVAFMPQDGQAANFEVFMLPAMTASVLLARRGRGFAAGAMVALATLAKQTGAATLLPVFYLIARRRTRGGIAAVGAGFSIPLVLTAFAMGPGQLIYWTVLGNGSYVGMKSFSTLVLTMVTVMTLLWVSCNLPIVWKLPAAWRDRRRVALDGLGDTDLWLWLLSAAVSVAVGLRFFGHYYIQLVPPVVLLSAGALARGARRWANVTVAASLALAVAFTATGFFLRPGTPEPNYESVARYLSSVTGPDDPIFVWGSVPEIYWASDRRPATGFITSPFLTGNYAGRPPEESNAGADTQAAWDEFFKDFTAHPPKYFVDTSPAKVRGAQYYPIDKFPKLAKIVKRQYRYKVTIDDMVVYERRA
jgi:4-amino-4-deoxy-L-arabinose transferase-like glycosyltransferase